MSRRTAVHIYLSHFQNESRILKQTKVLVEDNIVESVVVIALWKEGLLEEEVFGESRTVRRLSYKFFKGIPPRGLGRITKYFRLLEVVFTMINIIRKERPTYVNFHQVMILPLVPFVRLVSPKSKLIYDTHELETETNGLKGITKSVFKIFERCFIHSFAHVFVVSPSIEKWYRDTYGISNITTVLNCPESQQVPKHDHFRTELGISSDSKIFLYQGALFKGRGIEDLLEAFKKINDPRYSVVFMGYGECDELIKEAAEKFPNIYFYKAVPPEIVLRYTSSADFGLSLIENVCLSYYYCLPNKIFEYLMAGLPCVVSNIPELKGYVDTYKVGVVSETNSSEHIIESILNISNIDPVQLQNSVVATQNSFNWENESRKMIHSYKHLSHFKN